MEYTFSIEMKSKKFVRHMSISNEDFNRVLFEGSLGKLKELEMIEGAALLVIGDNGVLRIDLSEDELRRILSDKKEEE